MRPNIILTIADDQRFDTIAAHGNRQIRTPNLDRLAERGTSYRRAQHGGSSHGAVCAPSRAQLHTGRRLWATSETMCAIKGRVTNERIGDERRPHSTLGQILGQSGYDTFAVGKWHNGEASFLRSFAGGRNLFFGGMCPHYCVVARDLVGGKLGPGTLRPGHSTDLFASAAVEFLRSRAREGERPFFLYVAFTAPHDPRETYWRFRRPYELKRPSVPASFAERHPFELGCEADRDEVLAGYPRRRDEIRMHTADYYAMITHLDEALGRIHRTLRETGLADHTIVVHTADHGLAVGRHGLMGKQNLYDHSTRVPLIAAGPGFEKGVDDDRLCYQHDLFPTLLERAGVGHIDSDYEHLQSSTRRETVGCAYAQSIRSIRDRRMKLIEYRLEGRRVTQLFDTTRDPDEIHDLSRHPRHQAILRRLRAALRKRMKEQSDPFVRAGG